MADMTHQAEFGPVGAERLEGVSRAGMAVQVTGALLSVALLAGMGVWGYQLIVRDAHGVPVVRAMGGPMREAPENPGGELALHTGLAVNEVAAVGEAAPPEDTLLLAPVTADLTEEDLLVQPTAEAGEVLAQGVIAPEPTALDATPEPIQLASADAEPMSEADILAWADQIAAGAEPLSALADEPIVSETAVAAAVGEAMAALDGATVETTEVVAEADVTEIEGGLTRALRPPARPGSLVVASSAVETPSAADTSAAVAAQPFAVSTAAIPAGTILVQLGAYDSTEMAGTAWQTLASDFAEFMDGREHLIQEAASGGRAFFRLRATGFADLDEARRFCSALVAEDAACIPVVVR